MKEAFRLLNKSIIRVETPDINLDQDDEQQMEDQEDQDGVNGKVLVENFFKEESTSILYSLLWVYASLQFLTISDLIASRNLDSHS